MSKYEKIILKILKGTSDRNISFDDMRNLLLQLGFRSIVKETRSMEALELAKKHLPDLIFLDIMMPGLDGGKVKERLNENPKTKDIPVVFVSSIISKREERRIGRLAGGEIMVAKPYSSDEILKAIEKTLGSL